MPFAKSWFRAIFRTVKQQLVEGYLYSQGPLVVYLLDAMKKTGNVMQPGSFQCVPCRDTDGSGLFDPLTRTIRICEDAIQSAGHVQDTMAHELIHAFDASRVAFEAMDCRQRACSEIRAANLSGDCKWTREVMRGNWKNFKGQHLTCVRRRAIMSLAGCEPCRDENVAAIVEQIFTTCIADTEPFIEIP